MKKYLEVSEISYVPKRHLDKKVFKFWETFLRPLYGCNSKNPNFCSDENLKEKNSMKMFRKDKSSESKN